MDDNVKVEDTVGVSLPITTDLTCNILDSNEIKDEFCFADSNMQVTQEVSDLEFNIKSDDDISIKLELIHEELDLKTEVLTDLEDPTGKERTKQNPVQCSLCNYIPTWKNDLLQHLKTHTGKKPVKCSKCYYKCIGQSKLQRHIKTHHSRKPRRKLYRESSESPENALSPVYRVLSPLVCSIKETNRETASQDKNCAEKSEVSSSSHTERAVTAESNRLKASVKTTRARQRDFCYFCETPVLNFARHIERNHPTEIEVQTILSTPVKGKKRKNLLTMLRKKGNYLQNSEECVKPMKKSNVTVKFLPCVHCLGFYAAKQLWRHRKRCTENPSNRTSRTQSEAQNFLVKHLNVDQELKEKVFTRMRPDQVSLVAKKDSLICAFGARYLKTHREKHRVKITSGRMRELAKILIEIKKLEPRINSLFHALQPKYFDLFLDATKIVAKFNAEKDSFKSPTFAVNMGTTLKQCCEILLTKKEFYTNTDSVEAEASLKKMIELLSSHWRFDISHQAANDLKWNKITLEQDNIGSNGNSEQNYNVPHHAKSTSEDNSMSTQRRDKTQRKNRKLVPWTADQKRIVDSTFRTHITKKLAPKKTECVELIKKYPDILGNMTWLKIKVHIQNIYTKKLKS